MDSIEAYKMILCARVFEEKSDIHKRVTIAGKAYK